MSDERLIHLEERAAWIERHVRDQDKAMLELGDEVRRLKKEVQSLKQRLQTPSSADETELPDEKPPHY